MKRILFFAFLGSVSCQQKEAKKIINHDKIRLTIYTKPPILKSNKGTLINSQIVDLSKTKVDAFFCHKNLKTPYYMPTNGIYRDSTKIKECNWASYPALTKCYEYDKKGRVIRMQVEASGTTDKYFFAYDSTDRIISIKNHEQEYTIEYNKDSNISILKINKDDSQKELNLYYNEQ